MTIVVFEIVKFEMVEIARKTFNGGESLTEGRKWVADNGWKGPKFEVRMI